MSFRELILNNFWQKIFSLLLATLIWFAIDFQLKKEFRFPQFALRNPEPRDYRRPITVMSPAASTHAFKVDPNEVDVRVSADSDTLKKLDINEIRVFVEVTDVITNDLVPVKVSTPHDVNFEQVWPTHVAITIISPDSP